MKYKMNQSIKWGHTIPFCVADRPASLRILKGVRPEIYSRPMGIMTHANTSPNFQELFSIYPCSKENFCDAVNAECPHDKNISKCPKGTEIKNRTIKICDSGIFTKDGCTANGYQELFEIYERLGVEYGIIIDVFKDDSKTLKSAKKAMKVYEALYGKSPPFKLVGVSQGNIIDEYIKCYENLKEIGYKYIAIGGLLKKYENSARYTRVRSEDLVYDVLKTIRNRFPKDWLFPLGCYHPKRHRKFEELQIYGSDYKGWIFHYEKDDSLNKNEAQKHRFQQIRNYLVGMYDKLCAPKHLLILSCSDRKKKVSGKISASKLYDGINFRSLKKCKSDGYLSDNLDIVIISAEYGLIGWNYPIKYYNRRMTPERAEELRPKVVSKLKNLMETNGYNEIFVNLGKDYLPVLDGTENIIPRGTRIVYAEGRIGEKLKQTRDWLLNLSN